LTKSYRKEVIVNVRTGTDVMIFKNILGKKMAENLFGVFDSKQI
jgi:hypothetical protein